MSEEPETYRGNVYASGAVPNAQEIARQAAFAYPNKLSRRLLSHGIKKRSILDIGSGGAPELGRWVQSQGGLYTGLDMNLEFVRNLKQAGLNAIHCRAEEAGEVVGFTDTHTRFLLHHLDCNSRRLAIHLALDAASRCATFLAFSWKRFSGGDAMNRCIYAAREYPPGKVDHDYGEKMLAEIMEQLTGNERSVTWKRVARKPGRYYSEFAPIAEIIRDITVRLADEGRLPRAYADEHIIAVQGLREEMAKPFPELFQPPDVMIVQVLR